MKPEGYVNVGVLLIYITTDRKQSPLSNLSFKSYTTKFQWLNKEFSLNFWLLKKMFKCWKLEIALEESIV